jgi:histidyl-tRNA synthetase
MQNPKGTRDFYPEAMAVRRYIEDTWRQVSIRHGFVEVDGPTFEYLDLYKIKSGDEIVSQLFHFEGRADKEGQTDHFALRPEFTPTLARMVAAKANALPRPIKWFSIPRCYRGEAPQKGRGREFIQYNVDILGGDTPEVRRQFDIESAALCLAVLREFGLSEKDVVLRYNDRQLVEHLFRVAGLTESQFAFGFYLLDRIGKLAPAQRTELYQQNNIAPAQRSFFEKLAGQQNPLTPAFWADLPGAQGVEEYCSAVRTAGAAVESTLAVMGFGPGWAQYDASIVRGLAYYTGFVFEVGDTTGALRAIAGGGRYDKLVEMFGGPSLPAIGFGMGDMVLQVLLEEKKLLPERLIPKPDVFVVNALDTTEALQKLLAELRLGVFDPTTKAITQPGLAASSSYKSTKNIGKLLQEAAQSGAGATVILAPEEYARGAVKLKNMQTREECEVALVELKQKLLALRQRV